MNDWHGAAAAAPPWIRIPAPVESEEDRRALAAILTSCGLEVRVVKVRLTQKATPKKYLEYRAQ